jgi:hypothetical protein
VVKEKFDKFTNRLGIYNGLLFQAKVHSIRTLRKEKEISEKANNGSERPLLGSNLIYRNPLTGKNEFKYRHFIDINNLEENLEIIEGHYSNFIIAQCFEAFETFLKDIIAAYLISHPEKLVFVKEKLPYVKDKLDINLDSFDNCRESIRKISRSNNQENNRLFNII